VAIQAVTLGPVINAMAIVSQGIAPGDRIVATGQSRLRAGMHVEPRALP
jgi:multidrug efflux pump subunit AcrA (membrane-fusion protein)